MDEVPDVHVPSFTVNVYVVLAVKPVIEVVDPDPVFIPPLYVIVQEPDGNPVNSTLAVAVLQVGCVIVPITGAFGVAG